LRHDIVDWLGRIVGVLALRWLGLEVELIFLLKWDFWRVVGVVDDQRDLHGRDSGVEALGLFLQVPDVVAEASLDFCAP